MVQLILASIPTDCVLPLVAPCLVVTSENVSMPRNAYDPNPILELLIDQKWILAGAEPVVPQAKVDMELADHLSPATTAFLVQSSKCFAGLFARDELNDFSFDLGTKPTGLGKEPSRKVDLHARLRKQHFQVVGGRHHNTLFSLGWRRYAIGVCRNLRGLWTFP